MLKIDIENPGLLSDAAELELAEEESPESAPPRQQDYESAAATTATTVVLPTMQQQPAPEQIAETGVSAAAASSGTCFL